MTTLVETERATYETAWAVPQYHAYTPGSGYVGAFLNMARDSWRKDDHVLDAGCGTGEGALALQAAGFRVEMGDLTDAGLHEAAQALPFRTMVLWEPIVRTSIFRRGGKFDWVYCCDVLEHIPTPFTMLVIARLLEAARKGVFLSISLQPDQFGTFIVGKPLHQTVQSFTAWKEQIGALGEIVECRDFLHSGLYLVRPR